MRAGICHASLITFRDTVLEGGGRYTHVRPALVKRRDPTRFRLPLLVSLLALAFVAPRAMGDGLTIRRAPPIMPFLTAGQAQKAGFSGYHAIAHLRATALREVPVERGVYMVLRTRADRSRFLAQSSGGHFKGTDPTVSIAALTNNWVDSAIVLYVGKAGGTNRKTGKPINSTLRSRLLDYLAFGAGAPIGHWGGRYIWQLDGAEDLVVCWKATPDEEPVRVERCLIDQALSLLGHYPFANCRR